MKHKICVITGSRAEFGLLKPLLVKLSESNHFELRLVVTGSHLSKAFGDTQNEIESIGLTITARIPIPLDGDSKAEMAKATGVALIAFTDYFAGNRPDILVVLGDRYEIFAAATAAAMLGIPIAHIHGGETTEGAVDEFLRHSITKMSYFHFVACEEYRRRVIQLGEEPDRVFNVGALGVENIVRLPEMSMHELQTSLGFELEGKKYSVVTYHPVTMESDTQKNQLYEIIQAMDAFPQMKYIITKANADAGGRLINEIWEKEAKTRENWLVISSLGVRRYLSSLKHAEMIIGNSSSGIIEAPALKVPTVNIGDRQKGRKMAESVLCCEPLFSEIIAAMKKAMTPEFKAIVAGAVSPFGDGNTSERILTILLKLLSGDICIKKTFYDIPQSIKMV